MEEGDPEPCRQLQEGLIREARMGGLVKVGLELAVACAGASGGCSPLRLWLWR